MYRLIRQSGMPKWLKWLLYVALTLTCVYWIGWLIYKLLNGTRAVLHYLTMKEHWWAFLICFAILAVGTFLIAEFVFKLGWWDNIVQNLNDFINRARIWLDEQIHEILAPKN